MRRSIGSSRENRSNILFHVGALLAVTAWGAAFISTKVLLQYGLNPVEIYIYRFFIAYLLTLLICPRPLKCHSWKDEMLFLLCGVCGGSVYFIAENTAVIYTLVTNVSLIVTVSPLITTLIVGLVYKDERPSRGVVIGSCIAFVGVALVIFNSSFVIKVNPLGDLLALLAAICWAVYSVVLRPLSAVYSVWFVTRKTFFYGLITAIPFLMLESHHAPFSVLLQPQVLLNLGFLGIVASLLAYLLWSQTVKRLGAVKANNYLYFSPIVTLVLSAWLLGEAVTVFGYCGCALILAGVIFGEKFSVKDKSTLPRR